MIKYFTFTIIIFIFIFSFPLICLSDQNDNPAQLDSNIWEYFGTNENGDYYYNKNSLTKSSNRLSVSVCSIVTQYYRNLMVAVFKTENSELSKKHEKFTQVNSFFEIDCVKKRGRLKESIHYDDKGNVIYDSKDDDDWTEITPETLIESLYQKICVIQNRPMKKK